MAEDFLEDSYDLIELLEGLEEMITFNSYQELVSEGVLAVCSLIR